MNSGVHSGGGRDSGNIHGEIGEIRCVPGKKMFAHVYTSTKR